MSTGDKPTTVTTQHSCTGCGVLLECNGSHRTHEWTWHRRAIEAEAKLAALTAPKEAVVKERA